MIAAVLFLALAGGTATPPCAPCAPRAISAPQAVTVATPRGNTRIPVVLVDGSPMLPAGLLAGARRVCGAQLSVADDWAELTVVTQTYRFLIGAPFMVRGSPPGPVEPLVAGAMARSDTLLLPLEFISAVLPRLLRERYSWDPVTARFTERGPPPVVRGPTPQRLPNGLLPGHQVVIDPGHGGIDPGNPSLYLPRGMKEKDVALSVGFLLRDELKRRGIQVRMTRATDTLINLVDRGPMCSSACDLFVSLHVNSLARRANYTQTRGYETYFLSEAKTEDAAATARMENEAIRYEVDRPDSARGDNPLDFIFRDMLVNEHLRESARAAAIVQDLLAAAHTGPDRGVRQANFAVLRTARRPSILVELGFSTNRQDSAILGARSGQRALATALADAIVVYLLEYEKKTGQAALGATTR